MRWCWWRPRIRRRAGGPVRRSIDIAACRLAPCRGTRRTASCPGADCAGRSPTLVRSADSTSCTSTRPFLAHYAGLAIRPGAGHARGRDVSHAVRRIPASLRAAAAAQDHRQPGAPLQPLAMQSGRCRDRAVARHAARPCSHYGIDKRIEILPTGLPAERFRPGDGPAFRRRHDLNQERPLLLFVGRAAHEKNIGFLLEMMLELRRRCVPTRCC